MTHFQAKQIISMNLGLVVDDQLTFKNTPFAHLETQSELHSGTSIYMSFVRRVISTELSHSRGSPVFYAHVSFKL